MKKVGDVILSILPLLVCLGIQVMVYFGAILIYGIVQGIQIVSMGETDTQMIAQYINGKISPDITLLIQALSAVTALIVFVIWYRNLTKKEARPDFKRLVMPKNLLAIVFTGIGLQIGISFILNILANFNPQWFDSYGEILEQLGMGSTLISAVYIGLIAPFSEEFIFRGVILKLAGRAIPFAYANILQALLFGIYHGNLVQGLYAFVIGIFLGLVCHKLKTIAGSILLHVVINVSGLLLDNILTEKVLNTPGMVLILLGVSIAGVVYGVVVFSNQEEEDEYNLPNYR